VTQLYLDESMGYSILAGMLILLGALWVLWGACWLRRVELRSENDAVVRTLGLAWVREGLGPTVRAAGRTPSGPVEIRWRRWFTSAAPRVRYAGQGAWLPLEDPLTLLAPPAEASPVEP
jgi:hypothetical protein